MPMATAIRKEQTRRRWAQVRKQLRAHTVLEWLEEDRRREEDRRGDAWMGEMELLLMLALLLRVL